MYCYLLVFRRIGEYISLDLVRRIGEYISLDRTGEYISLDLFYFVALLSTLPLDLF